MREATKVWLAHAEHDLKSARLILQDPTLTSMVAFHAQQALEKLLKGLLEEKEQKVPKIHDLERLYSLAREHWHLELDEDALRLIGSLYLNSRYPAEVGLLPSGRPTESEAHGFIVYAEEVMNRITRLLQEPLDREKDSIDDGEEQREQEEK
jgi:HEPN domain-containing protein